MKKILLTLSLAIACYSSSFAQWTTGTNIHNTNSGNVGIGVSNPVGLLSLNNQISNKTNSDNPINYTTTSGVPGQAILNSYYVVNTDGSGPYPRYLDIASVGSPDGTNGGGNIRFLTNPIATSSPAVERMRINSAGFVGIGTTTPFAKLSIVTTGPENPMSFQANSGGAWTMGPNVGSGSGNDTFGIYSYTFGSSHAYYPIIQFNGINGNTTLNGNLNIANTLAYGRAIISTSETKNNSTSTTASSALFLSTNETDTPFGAQFRVVGNSVPEKRYLSIQTGEHTVANNGIISLQLYGGNVGIGTASPDERLTVNGIIHSTEVKVTSTVPVPDYVFETDYKLQDLKELKTYLETNHHLPEIPSAKIIEKEGISLGDMNMKLLKKVEELTLYLIEKDDQLIKQRQNNQSQQDQINELKQQLIQITKTLTKN